MMKLTFLGTSDAIPTAKRNHTSILLTYDGENILVDCGEGTQRQFRKAKLNPNKINRILLSHWHGDHVLGLSGMLQSMSLSGYNKTLHIYGPKGTKKFMKELMKTFVYQGKHKIEVKEVTGKFFETKDFYLEAKPMQHGPPCNAYSFVKKGILRIDKKKLKKAKLPHGPLLSRLKHGKNIKYKGKTYLAKNLTYKDNETKISFVLDTKINKNITPFVKDSTILVSESTYSDELKDMASKHKHMTAKQVSEIAKKAKVEKLILTHLSQRYEKNPKKILDEAKKYFKNSFLAQDLDVFTV